MAEVVLWITDRKLKYQSAITSRLKTLQFEVYWCQSASQFQELNSELSYSKLVLSEFSEAIETEKMLSQINSTHWLIGSRKVATFLHPDDQMQMKIAISGFRDIIHEKSDFDDFMNRIQYAFSAGSFSAPEIPPKIEMPGPAKLSLPGKVIWISAHAVKIESNLLPIAGDIIHVSGPLFRTLGIEQMELKIIRIQTFKLNFRFSYSIYGLWKKDVLGEFEISQKMERLRIPDSEEKMRIFLVLQTPRLQERLLPKLDQTYDVSSSHNLNSLLADPEFFKPDIVAIENSYFFKENIPILEKFLKKFGHKSCICLLGRVEESLDIFRQNKHPSVFNLPKDLISGIAEGLQKKIDDLDLKISDKRAWYLKNFEQISQCEIEISSSIAAISPNGCSISVGHSIKPHSLLRLESPWLTKTISQPVWIKLLDHRNHSDSVNLEGKVKLEAIYSCLSESQKKTLAKKLILQISRKYLRHTDINFQETIEVRPREEVQLLSMDIDGIIDTYWKVISRIKKLKGVHKSKSLRYLAFFLLVACLVMGSIFLMVPEASIKYRKSGSTYVESLKKMLGVPEDSK